MTGTASVMQLGAGDRDLGGDPGVVLGEGEVGGNAAAGGLGTDPLQHERRDTGARHARHGGRLPAQRPSTRRARTGSSSSASGIGTVSSTPLSALDRYTNVAATSAADLHAMRHAMPAGAGVERGEPVVLPAEHRHTGRLQVLQRPREVEEGLGAGAHGHDGMRGDRVEIGRDVAADLDAAMHPADAAGGEHPHTRPMTRARPSPTRS